MITFKKTKSPAIDESFINLIHAAYDDEQIRSQLISILSLEKTKRKFALNLMLQDMKIKKAPKEFIESISALLNDDIAEKALELLNERKKKK